MSNTNNCPYCSLFNHCYICNCWYSRARVAASRTVKPSNSNQYFIARAATDSSDKRVDPCNINWEMGYEY